MKILQIFGVVVAVHAGLFLVLFAVPGCRSSGKTAPATPAVVEPVPAAQTTGTAAVTPSLANAGALDDSSLNPAVSSGPGLTPVGTPGRFSPTRPGAEPAVEPETKPSSTYTVAKGDSLWAIAKKHGISVAELAAANNLSDKASLRIGQSLIVPGDVAESAPSAAAAAAAPSGVTYTVMPGDTLSGIAKKNGVTVTALRAANKLAGDALRAGQLLNVPAVGAKAAASATTAPVAKPAATGSLTHTVKPGETLGVIARKYNVNATDLATANSITDPRKLRVGQELKVPGWQSPAAKPAAAAVAPAAPPIFSTEPVTPASVTPEPIVPETLIPAPLSPAPVEPVAPALVPVVPVEDAATPVAN